ncbi:MAG TPA: hypothetical protein VM888_03600 [Chitinophagaceae bacterium]|jgi:hypothetical protein|nr:hypothetical protein [Chitinophagaceae bacterium]
MKEISRMVVGLIAVRIMKHNESQWYEMFESNTSNRLEVTKWRRIDATKLHLLRFDRRIEDWLNQHNNSEDNGLQFPNE